MFRIPIQIRIRIHPDPHVIGPAGPAGPMPQSSSRFFLPWSQRTALLFLIPELFKVLTWSQRTALLFLIPKLFKVLTWSQRTVLLFLIPELFKIITWSQRTVLLVVIPGALQGSYLEPEDSPAVLNPQSYSRFLPGARGQSCWS